MSAAASPSPPTGLMPRFYLFIEAMKRGLVDGARYRQAVVPLGPLGPLVGMLLNYLVHTRRRPAGGAARARHKPPGRRAGASRAPAARHSAGAGVCRVPASGGLPTTCARCWTIPRCGPCSPPRRKRDGSCGRCGASSPPIRCRGAAGAAEAAPAQGPASRGAAGLSGWQPSPQPLVCSSQPKPLTRGEGEAAWPAPALAPATCPAWGCPAPAERATCPPPWLRLLFQR